MSNNKEKRTVILWHMNGCIATFYKIDSDTNKKVPVDTVWFTNKAYLAFKHIDSLTITIPAIPYLQHLTTLQLQNNHLKTVPEEIWKLSSLEQLNLGSNQLSKLSPSIALLNNLNELLIHNNLIRHIPSQIGELKKLRTLDITNNLLNCLPSELFELELKHLWMDQNQFDMHEDSNKMNTILSLRDVCTQIAGLLCAADEESRSVVECMPDMIKEHILVDDYRMIPKCHICHSYIFHEGLIHKKIESTTHIPIVYKACSHPCLITIINNKQ